MRRFEASCDECTDVDEAELWQIAKKIAELLGCKSDGIAIFGNLTKESVIRVAGVVAEEHGLSPDDISITEV